MNLDLDRVNVDFLEAQTELLIRWARDTFQERIFMTSAFGANGTVLMDVAGRILPQVPIYFINTGYHFAETLEIRDACRKAGFNLVEISSGLAREDHDFEKIGHDICCRINKVEPMNRIFAERQGHLWITALGRDQAETRRDVPLVQELQSGVYRLSPLAMWRQADIWLYIRSRHLKYNRLYDQGYTSIGCSPCTTPVKRGEDIRAGRWRGSGKKECGLHVDGPVAKGGEERR